MKRLTRTDVGIDYVKLFAAHARQNGLAQYDAQAIAAFGDEVRQSIGSSARSESRVRGLRVEALFASVVASIGSVVLLRAEDAGDVFYAGDDIGVPDYRIVTKDGSQMLVEVKAVHSSGGFDSELSVSHAYVERLQRYAALVQAELRFAIFWEATGWWTLNRLESFTPGIQHERRWRLPMMRAFVSNEMIRLGDFAVATAAPLQVRILFDPGKSDPMQPNQVGEFTLTSSGMQVLSQGRVLRAPSAALAWKLIWYGRWVEQEPEHHFEDGHLLWIEYSFVPMEWDEPDVQASGGGQVGFLSEMVSRAYLRGAKDTILPADSSGILEPGFVGALIPDDWFTEERDLPITVLRMKPNFDYDEQQDQSVSDASTA